VVGKAVEFHVTGSDVNHGFGIYDPQLRLVAQTQAMPGYTNVLRHTFTKPGSYKILCLEYCGLAHHTMMAEFNVRASD
jgi:cytochrome c oxidase subunit II